MSTLPTTLFVDAIRTDGGTQSRAALNDATVAEYAEAMGEGADFPRVVVFYDGSDYWLADGFHRHAAHVLASLTKIDVDCRQGRRRDAILYSVGANSAHGLRRTNADKRRAVAVLLADDEWSAKSDRWISEKCSVDHKTVAAMRPTGEVPQLRTGSDGKARKQPKSKKGAKPKKAKSGKPDSAPPPEPAPVIETPVSLVESEEEEWEWDADNECAHLGVFLSAMLRRWPREQSTRPMSNVIQMFLKTIEGREIQ